MMQGYYESNSNETVIFDAFYRKNPCGNGYAIAAGLDQVIDYIKNLHFSDEDIAYLDSLGIFHAPFLEYLRSFHFEGDIWAIPEGSVVFPYEPLVKVIAPIMQAQLIETALLNIVNHQSLIATKTAPVSYRPPAETASWSSACAVPRDGCRCLRCPCSHDRRAASVRPTCLPVSSF